MNQGWQRGGQVEGGGTQLLDGGDIGQVGTKSAELGKCAP